MESAARNRGVGRRAALLAVLALAFAGSCHGMRDRLLRNLLYFPAPDIEATPAQAGMPFEDVAIRTADGETLHAWWVPARARPAIGHVLFFHGNAGNISHRIDLLLPFWSRGIDVLLVDYRGYGRSTGDPSEEGTAHDARAALAAVKARAGVDPRRIFYFGESLGGAVATVLASEEPPAGLVLQSTFTSVADMARLHYPVVPRLLVPPAYDTLGRIPSLQCPLLVIHGDADDLVPVDHGRALFAAARGPKRLEIVRGAGHNDLPWVAGDRFGEAIAAFVRAPAEARS